MSPSTNTHYYPNISTEFTTTSPLNPPYVIQTDFANTIKDLLAKFDDNFKESLKETIADQSVKFDAKLEKQQQTLSLQIRYYSTKFPFKLDDQDNKISSFT